MNVEAVPSREKGEDLRNKIKKKTKKKHFAYKL